MKKVMQRQRCAPFSRRLAINVFLSLVALVVEVAVSHADLITVLSQEYSIGGEGSVPLGNVPVGTLTVSYDMTSSSPVSNDFSFSSPGSQFDFGWIVMNASATGEVTSESASVAITRYFDNSGSGRILSGHASASITFLPLVNSMVLTPTLDAGLGSLATITDVTTGSLLFSQLGGGPYFTPALLSFNLGDVYAMSITSSEPYTIGEPSASLLLHPVPEETAPLSFLGLGLVMLALWRRQVNG